MKKCFYIFCCSERQCEGVLIEISGEPGEEGNSILCMIKQGLAYMNLSLDPNETVKAGKCICNEGERWWGILGDGEGVKQAILVVSVCCNCVIYPY